MLFSSDIPTSAIYGIECDARTGQEAVNGCVVVTRMADGTFPRYKSRKRKNVRTEIKIPN